MKNKILGVVELQLLAWLIDLADIIEGLISVFTLGFVQVRLACPIMTYRFKRKYYIEEENQDEE